MPEVFFLGGEDYCCVADGVAVWLGLVEGEGLGLEVWYKLPSYQYSFPIIIKKIYNLIMSERVKEPKKRLLLKTLAGSVLTVAASTIILPQTSKAEQLRDPKIIFIHGWQGQGSNRRVRDGWWTDPIKDYSDLANVRSIFPNFPGGVRPDAQVWVSKLGNEVRIARQEGKNALLLGFSLGTRAALLLIDACLKSEGGFSPKLLDNIMGMVLVAPFSNDTENARRRDGAYANFFEYKVNTTAIAKAVPLRKIIHSRIDQQVPFEHGEELAGELLADLIEGGTGHFTSRDDGAIVIQVIDEMVRKYRTG